MSKRDETLQIFTLGQFQVKRGTQVLTKDSPRASKRWRFFQVLLTCRDRDVSFQNLVDYLDLHESVNPREALQALAYNLRQTLRSKDAKGSSEPYIVTRSGLYFFNPQSDHWLDAQAFATSCIQASRLAVTSGTEALPLYQKAFDLYGGDYLEGAESSRWVLPARIHYRGLYRQAMLEANQLLQASGQYEAVWELFQEGLKHAPFEESFHRLSIQALLDGGRKSLARIQHKESVALFQENSLSVPAELIELEERLKNEKGFETNPREALEKLQIQRANNGAFQCGIHTFESIYELERGRSERSGAPICLLHLHLAGEVSPAIDDQASTILKEVLQNNLRKGDVVCHWSQRHFVLMLDNVSKKQVDQILKRIRNEFHSRATGKKLRLKSRIWGGG